ncbi:succinate dehydrogenase or fumarate reductase, flavoprotein subunit [Alkalidesulfovibrio alkalitolerans DSM 16529]|uniref:succinate dehydrogenase n=1 Tax=Alkalidesulfovibrio alkalitolerans DSM 16529 TaxID=1121439 RepID=S7T478_9BACT|nr:fumarate reductase flavoprotein subunit [Alkalidesulfovibrio alkalitolerans]EPR31396.1 succinate dehydrogenase or fumarate reductase, flavoprotein subunit [Alkalidesulfovibrio alkalitolerans DSM 16529]
MQTFYSDLLVVGAGLSGERIAVEAAEAGFSVIVLSIVPARRSHSSAAQGGMQAALGNCAMGKGDCPDVHFADTVKGSDWGCDQEVARLFADTAPIEMRRLAHWGVPWNRVVPGKSHYFKGGEKFEKYEEPEKEGLITARSFGGTAKWRTCYTSDGTGHAVMCTMDNRCAELGIDVRDRSEAIALIHDGQQCYGAVVRCLRTGELHTYLAKATAICTGGFGRIYKATTNAVICDGGGHVMTMDTGVVPLGNPEAIQFHPTGIVPTDILVTEGCRGDGGTLLDANRERFMHIYEPDKAELASRDVVSRWMTHHMRQGKGVKSPYGEHLYLDIRHLGDKHISTKLREVDEICKHFLGIDPRTELIPVRPTQHYTMAGVRTDKSGAAYGLKGLFSAGEAACWDMHGFNRLGGNSLAETVVAGGIIGKKVAEYLAGADVSISTALVRDAVRKQQERIAAFASGANGSEDVFKVREAMQDALMDGCFVFRNGKDLEACILRLQDILDRARKVGLKSNGKGASPELAAALKIEGQVKLAMCIAVAALARTESRGSHAREDHPERNDRDWLKRTLAVWPEGADMPVLSYEAPSSVWEIPPGDRGYGGGTIIPADKLPGLDQDIAD